MSSQPSVIVFTTPSCSWCRVLKDHLRKNHISFKEIDIAKDPRAAQDIARRTGQQGVPVTLINNRPIVGFKKEEINRLLNIKGG